MNQFNKYLDNIALAESILTGQKKEFQDFDREETIKLMVDMGFKVPK